MNPAGPNKNEEFSQTLDPRFQRPYKFSPEEARVLAECNKESFYQRCLPIGTLLGVGTYLGVQSGYLRPSARFGAIPKVMVSVIIGYFAGKFSYQSKCAEKLMQLPNSQIGEMLRKRRKGTLHESLDSTFGPGMSLAPFSGISSSDTYTDVSPSNSFDMDTSRPQNDGLDDSHRPSMDNPIYEEEMPPVQKHATTYEELRRQNREEYQQKRTANYKELKSVAPQSQPPQASPRESPPKLGSGITNKYGDTME